MLRGGNAIRFDARIATKKLATRPAPRPNAALSIAPRSSCSNHSRIVRGQEASRKSTFFFPGSFSERDTADRKRRPRRFLSCPGGAKSSHGLPTNFPLDASAARADSITYTEPPRRSTSEKLPSRKRVAVGRRRAVSLDFPWKPGNWTERNLSARARPRRVYTENEDGDGLAERRATRSMGRAAASMGQGPPNERQGDGGSFVFHFFPRARRTKAIVEDPIVED